MILAYIYANMLSHMEELVPGTIDGEHGIMTEYGAPKSLPRSTVNLSTGLNVNTYTTDALGLIEIDLVNDLGLYTFDRPHPVTLRLSTADGALKGELQLDPRDWTVPHLQASGQPRNVRAKPDAKGKRLGQLQLGAVYTLTGRKQGSWEELVYNGQKAWVYQPPGKRFWAPLTYFDPRRPPNLTASLEFGEASGNGFLDADEKGELRLKLTNKGRGLAHRVSYKITPGRVSHLSFDSEGVIGDIPAGQTRTYTIPFKAGKAVVSREVSMNITFIEANGFEPPPVRLTFSTRKFSPPVLTIADVGVADLSGNGMIERGELADITARIQNAGQGPAKDVKAEVRIRAGSNVFLHNESQRRFSLGTLKPGQYKDITFSPQ